MPDKKASVSKNPKNTDRRMIKPQAPRSSPNSEQAHKAAAPTLSSGARQLATYEAAIKLFHARKFKEARDLFTDCGAGPERDIAQRSRVHASMCDRRLHQAPAVNLSTAEECYNYGVAMINAR